MNNWKTQLNILWLGQAILMAVQAMSLPYWPLYIQALGSYTSSEIRFWSAAIYLAPFVSSIISSPLWGNIGDRYGYKPMVIRAVLGLFITQTLILFTHSVLLIFFIRLLQGVLAGFIVAAQTWGLAISPEQERGATMGKLQSATAVGTLFGPVFGGIIATFCGYHAIFTSSSIICAVIAIFFIFFLQNVNSSFESKKEPAFKLKQLTQLQQTVFTILSTIVLLQLARSMIIPVFALFVTEKLHGNDMTIAILYAATGFMIFITAPFWGKYFDHKIKKNNTIYYMVILLLCISAFTQAAQAYAETAFTVFMLRLFWGVCLGGLLPVLLNLLVVNHERQKGFYLGIGNSATKLGNLLGILIGAFIEGFFGFTNSFLVTAFVYILAAVLMFVVIPNTKKQALFDEKIKAEGTHGSGV